MASEAFYTTAAQVLPTVLIALAIEMGTIMLPIVNELKAHWAEEQRRWTEEHLTPKLEPLTAAQRALRRGLQATLCVTAAFLAGEISALLAIAFEWFNPWTLSITGACMLVMTIAAAVIPLVRLLSWTKL